MTVDQVKWLERALNVQVSHWSSPVNSRRSLSSDSFFFINKRVINLIVQTYLDFKCRKGLDPASENAHIDIASSITITNETVHIVLVVE